MRRTFASYQHTVIGFPGVILKWHELDQINNVGPYITINGVIRPWSWEHNRATVTVMSRELKRFDDYVRAYYREDESVQG